MRLALLGVDADTLAIAAGVLESHEHQLVAQCECDTGPYADGLDALGPAVPEVDNWEALLDASFVDAVIVGHGDDQDRRAEQLRKFVQTTMPVLTAHPLLAEMLVYYELDMMRRDSGAVLLPYLPERSHPAIVELARLYAAQAEGPIGKVEQLVFERHLVERDKAMVTRHFARDVDVLRAICGEIKRIGAPGTGGDNPSYSNLNVQMSVAGDALLRWSVAPADGAVWGRLSLLGAAGRAVVTMPGDASPWTFELSVGGSKLDRQLEGGWNPPAVALERLSRAVAGETVRPDWVDAARSVELTETIERSLKRGRTIEMHYEDYTEESTFKGTMAAVGCCVLIVGLVFLVLIAVLEDFGRAVGRRIPLVAQWPYLLLGLLAFFLVLQLLLLALRREKRPPSGAGQEADRDD